MLSCPFSARCLTSQGFHFMQRASRSSIVLNGQIPRVCNANSACNFSRIVGPNLVDWRSQFSHWSNRNPSCAFVRPAVLLLPSRVVQPSCVLNSHAFLSTSSSGGSIPKNPVLQKAFGSDLSKPSKEQITNTQILQTLAKYLWQKDNFEFKLRVGIALGFLVGAKVLNVQVPFLFKLAIDWLTTASNASGSLQSFTNVTTPIFTICLTPVAVLVGYGIARAGASAFNELRNAIFSKVALRTIRSVSRKGQAEICPSRDRHSKWILWSAGTTF